jgi:dihydroorotase (multifunctional complex type)
MSIEILPGLVDVHVHLRDPGATQKEDFETGTKAALAGGYTTILDMPNNPKATIDKETLENKINLAKGKVFCDLGFHFGATGTSIDYYKEIKDDFFGLKLYMSHTTGPLLIENNDELNKIFKKYPKNRLILIHAEGKAFDKGLELAEKYHHRVHICHVSQEREILAIKKLKEQNFPITCEVTPHHLFLNDDDAKYLGSWGKMRPPLQPKKDVAALWKNLDVFDIIASDHAPHTKEEKNSEQSPNGVPGLETSIPLLLNAIHEKRLSLKRLIELTSIKPKEIFGIRENNNNYTLVDTNKKQIIGNKGFYTKCAWSPFAGMEVRGEVVEVVIRNNVVFKNGEIKESPKGRVISRV